MASWDLLHPDREWELHRGRLLNVEEKPFKRVTKRLSTVSNLTMPNGSQNSTATPKPNMTELKEDLTLDFAAFDGVMARFQFLLNANTQERKRYAADQERILSECQTVRINNAQLREQLEESRATLAQRKKLDELAVKITQSKLLRPREDQITNLAKLEEECRELERESETYSETWRERREQFNRIMEEGMLLRRQIRDEKEEVDRREGMNDGGDDDAEPERSGQTPRIDPNDNATPRPDGDGQVKVDGDVDTPRQETPAGDTPGPDTLKPLPGAPGSLSRSGSKAPSRDASPMRQQPESGEDVEMEDSETQKTQDEGESTPRVAVEPPDSNGEGMEVDN